jgi:hypothetical protein
MGNMALVRRHFDEVLSKGHLERIDHLFALEFVSHPAAGGPAGLTAYTEAIRRSRTAFPDLQVRRPAGRHHWVVRTAVGLRRGRSTQRGRPRGAQAR